MGVSKALKPTKRKQGLANNKKTQERASALRIVSPLSLKGVGEGKLIRVTRDMFDRLDVDKRYQRDRIGDQVNKLITAIQSGGMIPDPVTLVKRNFSEAGVDPKKLWIIDGQQRTCAFFELDQEFQAMVHEAESLEAERAFFLVMQQRSKVSANTFVHSWAGPSADLLRAVDAQPNHPLAGRILWKTGATNKIGAAILIRGLLCAVAGVQKQGDAGSTLSRCDHYLKSAEGKAKGAAFMRLAAAVFPKYAKGLPMAALGMVAHVQWEKGVIMPPDGVIRRISQINWETVVPSQAERFRPVVEMEIRKRWK